MELKAVYKLTCAVFFKTVFAAVWSNFYEQFFIQKLKA